MWLRGFLSSILEKNSKEGRVLRRRIQMDAVDHLGFDDSV